MAHYEPPHQDLRRLQIQLFSFLVLKELKLFSGVSASTAICREYLTTRAFLLEKNDLNVDVTLHFVQHIW